MDTIETHSLVQDFFFGDDFMLGRHDYSVNIAGGFDASQLTSDYIVANGIWLPTERRAYTRGPDRRRFWKCSWFPSTSATWRLREQIGIVVIVDVDAYS